MLDTVLDPNRHEGIESQIEQRQLARQVVGAVPHRGTDDPGKAIADLLTRIRVPATAGLVVVVLIPFNHRGVGLGGDIVRLRRGVGIDRGPAGHGALGDQLEPRRRTVSHVGVDLQRRTARVRRHGGGHGARRRQQARPVDGGEGRALDHRRGGRRHQRVDARHHLGAGLPGVAPVRQRDVRARHAALARPATGGDGRPQGATLPLRARHRGVAPRAGDVPVEHLHDRRHVDRVPVHVQLRDRVEQRVRLGFLALERVQQVRLHEPGVEAGRRDRHGGHRVGRELQEGHVAVVDGLAHGVGEPHLVAHALDPVLLRVDRPVAGAVQDLAVDGGEQGRGEGPRLEAGDLGGQLAQQHVDVRGVAGAAHLELARELALLLDPGHELGDGLGAPADGGVGGRRVDGRLDRGELRVVGDDLRDLVGRVLHERHGAGVLVGDLLLRVTHEARADADHAHGVLEVQSAGGVGGGDLAHGVADHGLRARAQRLEGVNEGDLDGEDADLRGLHAVGHLVVEEHLGHAVSGLEVDELVHRVQARGEQRVGQVQLLGHLAVLRAEAREHPHVAGAGGSVGGEYAGAGVAGGERAQSGDELGAGVAHHGAAGAPVVAGGQRACDGAEVERVVLRLEPVGDLSGGGPAARRERARDDQDRGGRARRGGAGGGERLGVAGHGLGDAAGHVVGARGVGPLPRVGALFGVGGGSGPGGDDDNVTIHPAGGRIGACCGDGPGFPCAGIRARRRVGVGQGHHGRGLVLGHHDVGVGAAESEAGHPGQCAAAVAGPGGGVGDDAEPGGVEVDVRVGAREVQGRRQGVLVHAEDDLGQSGRAGGGLHVAEVGLCRPQQGGLVGVAAAAEDLPERAGLDGVTEDGAGAVGLDVVDLARVDARIGVRLAQHGDLGVGIGRGHAVGTAVGVDG